MVLLTQPKTEKKSILILSGGVDSTTLLYHLISQGTTVYALSFDYGQKHKKELEMAKATCEKLQVNHKIIDISSIKELFKGSALIDNIKIPEGHYGVESMKATVVPNRNMIMLSLAIAYAISNKIDDVFYGAHLGDRVVYPDCREEFVDAIQEVALVCHYYPIRIHTPYINFKKQRIVMLGRELGVDYSLTWSCYKGQDIACGKCGTCVERLEAFAHCSIVDPIKYEK